MFTCPYGMFAYRSGQSNVGDGWATPTSDGC
jgi:hypothetical protein